MKLTTAPICSFALALAIGTMLTGGSLAAGEATEAGAKALIAQPAVLHDTLKKQIAPIAKIRVGTGFGINRFRGFNTSAATQYVIDGEAITGEPTASQMGLGTRVDA